MRRRRAIALVPWVAIFALGLHGCAAIPLAVVAGSLLEAGGGVLVKTGTEYTSNGSVLRTFNVPVEQVHAAVLETLTKAQITITRDEASARRHRIAGIAYHRTVRVELFPLTPVLTALEIVVKRNVLASDKATASELLAETELVVAAQTAAAERAAAAEAITAEAPPVRHAPKRTHRSGK